MSSWLVARFLRGRYLLKMRLDKRNGSSRKVCTIGHSTRTLEQFLALLKEHNVERIVDIRSIPRSRHNPQFNRESLPAALRAAGIAYTHLSKLGGLRHARKGSPNGAWRNASFRGFADYMQTDEFLAGLARLQKLAAAKRSALMCAEAVPWRCHRSLVADALVVRHVSVEHILSGKRRQVHRLTPFARVRGETILYPPAPPARTKQNNKSQVKKTKTITDGKRRRLLRE